MRFACVIRHLFVSLVAVAVTACQPAAPDCICHTFTLACGESVCVDGVGYSCVEAGPLHLDPTACSSPDLGTVAVDLAKPVCVPNACTAACGPEVDNCGHIRNCGSCGANTLCIASRCVDHCVDSATDVDETDVDCGGAHCSPCALGHICVANTDCATGSCDHGICRPGTFTALASLPTRRLDAAVAANSSQIYVLGGYSGGVLDNVLVYDVASNTWSSALPMSTPRSNFGAAFGSDGKLYAVAGLIGNNWADGASRSGEVFDPAVPGWTALPALSGGREGSSLVAGAAGVASIGGLRVKITTTGGVTSYRHGDQASIDSLAPAASSWTALTTPLLTGRHDFGTTQLTNGNVLIVGGSRWMNNPGYSPGCVGFCSPAELEMGVPSVESCSLTGSCSAVADFPNAALTYATWNVAAAHIDDSAVYVFGNIERASMFGAGTSVTWKLDTVAKTWTRQAGLPLVHDVQGAAVVNGKIYVVTNQAMYLFTP